MLRELCPIPAGWLQQPQASYMIIPSYEQTSLSHEPLEELPFHAIGRTDAIFRPVTGELNRIKMAGLEQTLANSFLKRPDGKCVMICWLRGKIEDM